MNDHINKIKELVNNEEYQSAYQLCIQLINADPDNTKAIRLKQKIEKKVEKENQLKIDIELEKLNPLWKKQQYIEIIQKLQELLKYAPNYQRIKTLLEKANKKAAVKQQSEINNFITTKISEAKQLASIKNFSDALIIESQLQRYKNSHPIIEKTFSKIRINYADFELKQHTTLLNSKQHKDIIDFLDKLIKKAPDYLKLKKIKSRHLANYLTSQQTQQKEYLFQGIEDIKTLYQKKKYDKVIKATQELLQIDKTNPQAKDLQRKAIKKQERIMQKEISNQIKSDYIEGKALYKSDKSNFIKL